jgi:hypothetical protein
LTNFDILMETLQRLLLETEPTQLQLIIIKEGMDTVKKTQIKQSFHNGIKQGTLEE